MIKVTKDSFSNAIARLFSTCSIDAEKVLEAIKSAQGRMHQKGEIEVKYGSTRTTKNSATMTNAARAVYQLKEKPEIALCFAEFDDMICKLEKKYDGFHLSCLPENFAEWTRKFVKSEEEIAQENNS